MYRGSRDRSCPQAVAEHDQPTMSFGLGVEVSLDCATRETARVIYFGLSLADKIP
jgi:hypothetical protein